MYWLCAFLSRGPGRIVVVAQVVATRSWHVNEISICDKIQSRFVACEDRQADAGPTHASTPPIPDDQRSVS